MGLDEKFQALKASYEEPTSANSNVYNFVDYSAMYYNEDNQLYTVRGFQNQSMSTARAQASNAMYYLTYSKNDYLALKNKSSDELTDDNKKFIQKFEQIMQKMQLEIDTDGNFKNTEKCDFVQ